MFDCFTASCHGFFIVERLLPQLEERRIEVLARNRGIKKAQAAKKTTAKPQPKPAARPTATKKAKAA
jgi:hypothetical protein